ncbi:hypothetical protein Saso_15840 [Streptomyces asoensis]|uniref:Uncharacterized protein n=1 Tax=Streptomyces asoensis TaxID=249586 RepID=A0ABQ3RVP6_9ACTN|nr:hypothetical protein Saso_15840 [Streptomyces asoensis]
MAGAGGGPPHRRDTGPPRVTPVGTHGTGRMAAPLRVFIRVAPAGTAPPGGRNVDATSFSLACGAERLSNGGQRC